jgi:hypothetical protein
MFGRDPEDAKKRKAYKALQKAHAQGHAETVARGKAMANNVVPIKNNMVIENPPEPMEISLPQSRAQQRSQAKTEAIQQTLNKGVAVELLKREEELTQRERIETKRMFETYRQARAVTKRERALMRREINFTRETVKQARIETKLMRRQARQQGAYVGFWWSVGKVAVNTFRWAFKRQPKADKPHRIYAEAKQAAPPQSPLTPQYAEASRPAMESPYTPEAARTPHAPERAPRYTPQAMQGLAPVWEQTPSGLYVPNNKFVLTDEVKFEFGRQLHRIMAVNDFGDVKKNMLGGWVESPNNLAEHGASWIGEDAIALGNARVENDAILHGRARIRDNVRITDWSRVFGDADLSGNVKVSGHALVGGNVRLAGDEHISGDMQLLRMPKRPGAKQDFGPLPS